MNRVLRILAIAQVLACALYGVLFTVITHQPSPQTLSTVVALLRVVAPAGFYLGVVAAVVASVACFQQRRWGWAITLVVLVVLALYLAGFFFGVFIWLGGRFWETPSGLLSTPLYQLGPGLVLSVVVLAFTFLVRPRPDVTAG
ncbi:MAG TPA: hypothetical protein VGP82_10885 [Ktedonobacterales bacterium]|jgi:hypothetical protein|nr:hypothetical protein [Ktedonobacterales bacterium]